MDSYDTNLAELNKEKIEMILDGFLYNMRLIGNLICDISKTAIENDKKNPNGVLLKEDEKKCEEREKIERNEYILNEIGGRNLSKYEMNELIEESIKKIHKYRFSEILLKLQSYLRLSHILDKGGYEYTKFFTNEGDEPLEETLIRQSFDNEERRISIRHSTISKFILFSYPYWLNIKAKDISFLINHLSTLFPNSEFTDKLEIIFGKNDSHTKYVSSEDLERVWRLIHSCIKTAIKYMKYIGKSVFNDKRMINGTLEIVKTINIDIEQEIINWDVNWKEVRAVRK